MQIKTDLFKLTNTQLKEFERIRIIRNYPALDAFKRAIRKLDEH